MRGEPGQQRTQLGGCREYPVDHVGRMEPVVAERSFGFERAMSQPSRSRVVGRIAARYPLHHLAGDHESLPVQGFHDSYELTAGVGGGRSRRRRSLRGDDGVGQEVFVPIAR